MKEISEIIKILSNDINLKKWLIKSGDETHFNVCAYVRNKYLWNNQEFSKKLFLFFNVTNIDDLSAKLVDKITKQIN